MEKHKCKLCNRNFSNGRALGGHMRSHMMNLPVPPKPTEFQTVQLSFEAESSPSQSSSSLALSYGLRENPKRNFRFSDPEFADMGSVILQDRESETESSKNPTRRRSKRAWQLGETEKIYKKKLCDSSKNESATASSASDTTTEEDVAFCLMMLSRDYNNQWKKQKHHQIDDEEEDYDDDNEDEDDDDNEEEEEEEEDSFEFEELKSLKKTNKVRGRYKCETCDKVFRSYQALGGHRASHKKLSLINAKNEVKAEVRPKHVGNTNHDDEGLVPIVVEKKIHECPVCFRVFASGQALGGHKRTHVIGSATTTATVSVRTSTTKLRDSFIDLNLPAPVDDEDDASQFNDSAVSDAEFVKSH